MKDRRKMIRKSAWIEGVSALIIMKLEGLRPKYGNGKSSIGINSTIGNMGFGINWNSNLFGINESSIQSGIPKSKSRIH